MRDQFDVRSWRPWMDKVCWWLTVLVITGGVLVLAAGAFGWAQVDDEAKAECKRNGGRVHQTSVRYYSWTCIPGPR